ncbi:hypothetical protein EBESD8_56610 [Rhodococcus aetherivorans]|nr:hypothetical protein EBESD8_56610 [Rhodococcus aetherivorans]
MLRFGREPGLRVVHFGDPQVPRKPVTFPSADTTRIPA